jgi:hypothetical protein
MFWINILGRIFGAKRANVTGGLRKSNLEFLQFVDPMTVE